jgi:hypothetical protein
MAQPLISRRLHPALQNEECEHLRSIIKELSESRHKLQRTKVRAQLAPAPGVTHHEGRPVLGRQQALPASGAPDDARTLLRSAVG